MLWTTVYLRNWTCLSSDEPVLSYMKITFIYNIGRQAHRAPSRTYFIKHHPEAMRKAMKVQSGMADSLPLAGLLKVP